MELLRTARIGSRDIYRAIKGLSSNPTRQLIPNDLWLGSPALFFALTTSSVVLCVAAMVLAGPWISSMLDHLFPWHSMVPRFLFSLFLSPYMIAVYVCAGAYDPGVAHWSSPDLRWTRTTNPISFTRSRLPQP